MIHIIYRDLEIHAMEVTDVSKSNERESFWIEKLNKYCPYINELVLGCKIQKSAQ